MRFSLDDVVRYTVVDTALQSGTVQFVPGCVATGADRNLKFTGLTQSLGQL